MTTELFIEMLIGISKVVGTALLLMLVVPGLIDGSYCMGSKEIRNEKRNGNP